MKTLPQALQEMIKRVERLSPGVIFHMNDYDECVLGKTACWQGDEEFEIYDEDKTLKEVFGIDFSHDQLTGEECFFSSYRCAVYTDEQWQVIRLFTCAVGETITRESWLAIAQAVLGELNT